MFERIKIVNERFEKENGSPLFMKYFKPEDHMVWIEKLMKRHPYQIHQKNNILSLKTYIKPGGKYANIYWPSKLTHHQYAGFRINDKLKRSDIDTLQNQCESLQAYISPTKEYMKPKPKKRKSTIDANVAQN